MTTPVLPRVRPLLLVPPIVITPAVPVAVPASIEMFPELLVAPKALPEVIVTASEFREAELVLLDATLDALNAYGTLVSLNLGDISASVGEQLAHTQLVIPLIVIPR